MYGRAMLNSVYAALIGAKYLAYEHDFAMISGETANDIHHMRTAVHDERWTPIVESPKLAFRGAQGVSSDASASLKAEWGEHAFGRIAGAPWTQSTSKLIAEGAISINPLELLAAAAAVMLVG